MLLVLVASLLCAMQGCATVATPTVVKIPASRPDRALPNIVDVRPASAKAYRDESSSSSVSKFFADETLQPPFIELLRYKLAETLPPSLRDAKIELRQADIGFWIPLGYSPLTSTYGAPGTPAGAAIIGNLLGFGIVQGLRRANASEFAAAYIAIAINGQQVPASETVAIQGIKPEEAVRAVVQRVLEIVAARAATYVTPDALPTPAR
jgi:hypothetical protein